MNIMKLDTRLKLKTNNSHGFSLVELMIASTVGIGVILAVAHFINQPQKKIDEFEKNLDADGMIQYSLGQMAGDIEKSQVMRMGAIDCTGNNSLYTKKEAPAQAIKPVLIKSNGESYSMVASLGSSIAYKYSGDSVKVGNMKTDKTINYSAGDAVVLSSVVDSSIAGIYRVDATDTDNNVLKLGYFSQYPTRCGPTKVELGTVFPPGSELNPYRIDKILFIDYVVKAANGKKELLKSIWPSRGSDQLSTTPAMTNFESMTIEEDVGTAASLRGDSIEEMGRGFLKVKLDLVTTTQKLSSNNQHKVATQEKSQMVAGYRFQSSIRNDFSEVESAKPNALAPPPGCAITAKELEMDAAWEDDDRDYAHRYVKLMAQVPSDREDDIVYFDPSSPSGDFDKCWDMTDPSSFTYDTASSSTKLLGRGGRLGSFSKKGATRRFYICRVHEDGKKHVAHEWIVKSYIRYFEPIEGKFKTNNCAILSLSFGEAHYLEDTAHVSCSKSGAINLPVFKYDPASVIPSATNGKVEFLLPKIRPLCKYVEGNGYTECNQDDVELDKVKFYPNKLGTANNGNATTLGSYDSINCAGN